MKSQNSKSKKDSKNKRSRQKRKDNSKGNISEPNSNKVEDDKNQSKQSKDVDKVQSMPESKYNNIQDGVKDINNKDNKPDEIKKNQNSNISEEYEGQSQKIVKFDEK